MRWSGLAITLLLSCVACGSRSYLDDGTLPPVNPSGSSVPAGISCPHASGLQPQAPWPVPYRCPDNSMRVPVPALANPHIRWSVPVPFAYSTNFGWLGGTPLVDVGDVVYVGDGTNVLALAPGGTIRWRRAIGRPMAIGRGGILYTVTSSGLEAVRPDGTVSWIHSWATEATYWWPPITVGIDGSLYVADQVSTALTAIRPDGAVGWSVSLWSAPPKAGTGATASYAVGPEGTIYVATVGPTLLSSGNLISAVSPRGSVEWSVDSVRSEQPSPGRAMVAADGTVYIPTNGGTRVLGPDGSPRSSLGLSGALAAGADGDVFVRSDQVTHVRADGTKAWAVDAGLGGEVLVVNGAVYAPVLCDGQVSCTPGITAFDMNGEPLWTLGGVNPLSTVVGANAVYVLDVDMRNQQARLVAIGD